MEKNLRFVIAVVVIGIASVVGKEMFRSAPKQKIITPATFEDSDSKVHIKRNQNNLVVTVDMKETNDHYQYNFPISDTSKSFKESLKNQSDEQKLYQKQNEALILDAAKAYSYIIAGDYKEIKYCSQYHPLNTYKRKFDIRFKDKLLKAETILNKAYGPNGAKNFQNSIISNKGVLQAAYQQAEDGYITTQKLMRNDGMQNFTREDYCKMIDENADVIIDEDYKKFQIIIPGF